MIEREKIYPPIAGFSTGDFGLGPSEEDRRRGACKDGRRGHSYQFIEGMVTCTVCGHRQDHQFWDSIGEQYPAFKLTAKQREHIGKMRIGKTRLGDQTNAERRRRKDCEDPTSVNTQPNPEGLDPMPWYKKILAYLKAR